MSNPLKKFIPQNIQRLLRPIRKAFSNILFLSALKDANRYRVHSQMYRRIDALPVSSAQADLLRKMHSLEKGLALPHPVQGFGATKAEALIELVDTYRKSHGDDWYTRTCIGVLTEYAEFQRASGCANDVLETYLLRQIDSLPGGTIVVEKAAIQQETKLNFAAFARSRHSIRNFADEPVDEGLILEAIDIARKTPSVCNRSSGRVYLTFEREDIDTVLSIQSGARGFAETVPGLLIVASDVGAFYSAGERNQSWIDGGLFAMSLVYALHGLGLGTCMLNWSKTPAQDRRLRTAFHIEGNHNIILMIAVGHMPDRVRVALSPRADVESFFQKLQRRKN